VDALARAAAPEEEGGRGAALDKNAKRRIVLVHPQPDIRCCCLGRTPLGCHADVPRGISCAICELAPDKAHGSKRLQASAAMCAGMKVSNFLGASEPAGEEFIEHIVGKLNEQKCLLDVVSIDLPDDGADAGAKQTKNVNSDTLAQVGGVCSGCAHAGCSVLCRKCRRALLLLLFGAGAAAGAAQPAQRAGPCGAAHNLQVTTSAFRLHAAASNRCHHNSHQLKVLSQFRLKETAAFTYFSGTLDIGKQMKIGVKVRTTHPMAFTWHAELGSPPVSCG
jgi:hypothetical protein